MNATATQKKGVHEVLYVGLISGLAFSMLWQLLPIFSCVFLICILQWDEKRRKAPYSGADVLRFFSAFLLTMFLWNILMNWGAFQTGLIAGWNSGPVWHAGR